MKVWFVSYIVLVLCQKWTHNRRDLSNILFQRHFFNVMQRLLYIFNFFC